MRILPQIVVKYRVETGNGDKIRPFYKEPQLGKRDQRKVDEIFDQLAKTKDKNGPIMWARSVARLMAFHDDHSMDMEPVSIVIVNKLETDFEYIKTHKKLKEEYDKQFKKTVEMIAEED